MAALDRFSRIRLLPWVILQWWRVWRAWERGDWQAMVSLLQPMADVGLDGNGDYILLGIALARLGRFPEALWYFERVTRQDLNPVEQPLYFNEYAYVLARTDQAEEADHLLRSTARDRWPESQRRWASEFLASRPPQSAPPLQGLKPRVLH